MHIAIAGNIGAGKTTLTNMLAGHYNWTPRFESVDYNPYLEDFYSDMNRWSFNLQIYFLNKRFKDVVEISKEKSTIIQDRTIYEDARIFAPNLYEQGYMSDRDFKNYQDLFELMMSLVKFPDLLIYLRASIPHLVGQIQKRGRAYESTMRIDYLQGLNEKYEKWIADYKGKVLIIDKDNTDFQGKPEDFQKITDAIDAELFGLFPFEKQEGMGKEVCDAVPAAAEVFAIERHYSPLTVRAYEQDLKEFCSFLHVDPSTLEPGNVSDVDIKDWMISLLDAGEKPRTVRRKLSSLRSFWRFMLRVGYVNKDITRAIIAPKMDKPLPVFFKESEMSKAQDSLDLADDFPSMRDSLIIDMLYQTGMREAEIVGLSDGDVDLITKQVRIFGKRRKERIVPFGDSLAERIRSYMSVRNEQFDLTTQPAQPFLLTDKGEKMTVNNIYTIVRSRMGEVSTLKKHSPHVLRHTFATQMLNNGADINTIKTLLGHSSLAATQVYTHTTFEQLKAAYQQAHPRAKKN